MEWIVAFGTCFFPFFFAMNSISLIPTYITLTQGMDRRQSKRVLLQSMIVAIGVGLLFMFLGQIVLQALHIAKADFMIAGGALLFLISLKELTSVSTKMQEEVEAESVGAMPLGVPMIVGPGVLTAILLLSSHHHSILVGTAFVVNVILTELLFCFSQNVVKVLTKAGTKTLGKVIFLFLAALAVSFLYKGFVMAGSS